MPKLFNVPELQSLRNNKPLREIYFPSTLNQAIFRRLYSQKSSLDLEPRTRSGYRPNKKGSAKSTFIGILQSRQKVSWWRRTRVLQIGTVLLQRDSDDYERAYVAEPDECSKKLFVGKESSSSGDRCKTFPKFVWGRKFILQTIHKPLALLQTENTKSFKPTIAARFKRFWDFLAMIFISSTSQLKILPSRRTVAPNWEISLRISS